MKAAVVLAAGRASRMGRQKLLLRYQGRPLVSYPVAAALASAARQVIVVTGYERGAVAAALDAYQVTTVYNSDYAQGMASSLGAGIDSLPGRCRAVLVLLGDQPHVTADHCRRLWQRYDREVELQKRPQADESGGDAPIVYFHTEQGPRPPIIFDAAHFAAIGRLQGDRGARRLAEARPGALLPVAAPPGRWRRDVDTPDDYRALCKADSQEPGTDKTGADDQKPGMQV